MTVLDFTFLWEKNNCKHYWLKKNRRLFQAPHTWSQFLASRWTKCFALLTATAVNKSPWMRSQLDTFTCFTWRQCPKAAWTSPTICKQFDRSTCSNCGKDRNTSLMLPRNEVQPATETQVNRLHNASASRLPVMPKHPSRFKCVKQGDKDDAKSRSPFSSLQPFRLTWARDSDKRASEDSWPCIKEQSLKFISSSCKRCWW